MKTPIALIVAVVGTAGAVVGLLATCEGPVDRSQTSAVVAPEVAAPTPVAQQVATPDRDADGVRLPIDVVDSESGSPVANAMVFLRPIDGSSSHVEALTDAGGHGDGRLRPSTLFTVEVYEHRRLQSAGHVRTAATSTAQTPLRLAIAGATTRTASSTSNAAPGALEVEVFDGDAPVAGGVYLNLSAEHERDDIAISQTSGHQTLELRPGHWSLTAWIDDRAPVTTAFDVATGATVKRTIRLSRGGQVSGVVVDEQGAPVPRVFIEDAAPATYAGAPRGRDHTLIDGRFAVWLLAPGRHDLLVIPPDEFEETIVRGVSAPSASAHVVVKRRGVLLLHATFESGAPPAAGARVRLRGLVNNKAWSMDRPLGADGRVSVPWPASATGDVGIDVGDFVAVARNVTVPLGSSVDLGDIRFVPTCGLAGVLRDSDGRPQGRVWLFANGAARTVTDGNGAFAFHGLGPGTIRIDMASAPHTSFRVTVPTEKEVVLVIPRSGALDVVAEDASGRAIVGRRVDVLDSEGWPLDHGETDAAGRWSSVLAPGRYTVVVEDGPRGDAEVRADDVTVLRLR